MDIEKLRRDTPCENIYLNHVSTSVSPLPVLEAVNHYYEIAVRYGSTSARAQELTADLYASARRKVAGLVGASAGEIIFPASGTQAIGLVAMGLNWSPGDNVIIDETAFIANVAPYLWLRQTRGVEVRFAPAVLPGIVDLERLEALIDERTRLISLCHMANNLGVLQPAMAVGAAARRRGVPYLLDAANTVGGVELDVDKLGCDFLAASGRKYLRGPAGSAFLYVREGMAERIAPAFPTWNSGEWEWGGNGWSGGFRPHDGAERLLAGEINYPAVFGLCRAVQYAEEIGGVAAIRKRICILLERLMAGLASLGNVELLGPPEAGTRGGMVAFHLRGIPFEKVGAHLNRNNVGMMAHSFFGPGVLRLYGVDGVARLCVHCWNTEEEIDRAVLLLHPEQISYLCGES